MTRPTLRQFLTARPLDPSLVFLIEDVASACRKIGLEVRSGAFTGNLGSTAHTNVQGEVQKPLDIVANDIFIDHCRTSPHLAALVSEEVDEVIWLKDPEAGDYILYFDPLDGSSNLDVNMTVGSIFSVMRVAADGDRTILRKGREQIAAGFAVYGPATVLVPTVDEDVHGFTAEHGTTDFRQSHPDMTIAADTQEFAINLSRQRFWDAPVRSYVDDCLAGKDGGRGKDFNMRWIASLVAECYRILIRGGVFLYPVDSKIREKGGRLRLMYEANPMALIMERAGGAATNGADPILDLVPADHHQRVPLVLGAREEVAIIAGLHRNI